MSGPTLPLSPLENEALVESPLAEVLAEATGESSIVDGIVTSSQNGKPIASTSSDNVGAGAGNLVARGASMVLLLATLPRLATLIQGTLFCRMLPQQSVGQWEIAYKFTLVAAPLAVFGIPGSLGRFVEPCRARGRLRSLLLRALAVSTATSLLVVGLFALNRPLLSQTIFGSAEFVSLIGPWLVGLVGLLAYNTLTSLFLSLHLFRSAFWLQFGQSLMFGVCGVLLFVYDAPTTSNAIWAFAISNLLAAAFVLPGLRRSWSTLDHRLAEPADPAFLPRIMRFAVWLWLTNLLMGGFELADRFVLVQLNSLDPLAAHAELGQYHAALLLPKFFPALANLICAAMLPRLARTWETEGNEVVSRRLNLSIKCFALVLMTGAVTLLGLAPVIFKILGGVSDKFQQGQTLLPYTLALSIWGSLVLLVQIYLWCREHNGKVMLAYLIGLAANFTVSWLLVKSLGLWGAIYGATAANLVALILMQTFCLRLGLRRDWGLLLAAILPATLWLGFWPALITLLLALAAFAVSPVLFDLQDRAFLTNLLHSIRNRR